MKILRHVLESITEHARRSLPCECCGILMAQGSDLSVADHALWSENNEACCPERRYVLDHKTHLKAVEMEALDEACIIGYYHSHPGGKAIPSRRDAEQAIAGVSYLIMGLSDREIEYAAWHLGAHEMVPEPFEVGE